MGVQASMSWMFLASTPDAHLDSATDPELNSLEISGWSPCSPAHGKVPAACSTERSTTRTHLLSQPNSARLVESWGNVTFVGKVGLTAQSWQKKTDFLLQQQLREKTTQAGPTHTLKHTCTQAHCMTMGACDSWESAVQTLHLNIQYIKINCSQHTPEQNYWYSLHTLVSDFSTNSVSN